MKTSSLVASAFATAVALGLVGHAAAAEDKAGKEKCYGIAKSGQNDCANLSGSHSCAGQAKADGAADDWKYVAKGTCKTMNGISAEEAKAKMKSSK
ncbi:MAG: DUF2282 domain-containing protein [Burkholderiaceae bacterium]